MKKQIKNTGADLIIFNLFKTGKMNPKAIENRP